MELVYSTLGTLSGISLFILALAFSLALRPWPPHPWVRPWIASYWVASGTLLGLSLPVLGRAQVRELTFALLNTLFFAVSGLQALGWLRLRRPKAPLLLAILPVIVYITTLFGLGAQTDFRMRAVAFTSLQAVLHAVMAVFAYRGLKVAVPRLRGWAPALLSLHALFNALRCGYAYAGFPGGDFFMSLAAAVVEGFVFQFLLAYLQWLVLTDEEA